jgi:hypothetical protein
LDFHLTASPATPGLAIPVEHGRFDTLYKCLTGILALAGIQFFWSNDHDAWWVQYWYCLLVVVLDSYRFDVIGCVSFDL